MQAPFSIFLALKYLRPKRTFVSVVTIISVLGVLLGVAVLIIVISVMNGFDDMWREKILSFNAHITVTAPGVIGDPESAIAEIRKEQDVTGAAPFIQGLVFLQRHNRVYTPILRGIDPRYEKSISRVPEHISSGKFSVEEDEMIVGSDLARQMGARAGDKILIYSPQHFTKADEVYLPDELKVSGIFDLGMWDFDIGYVLTSLERARQLFKVEEGVQGFQVMTKDPFKARAVADALQKRLGPDFFVTTWMEQNKQLFAALRVEKNMMFILLIFITVVAAFGITSTLITMAVQKTREIGLLKAIGFSNNQVMGVFLWQGLIEGVIGTAAGIGTALEFLKYRNDILDFLSRTFHLDLLPKELYHLSEVPATTDPSEVAFIGVTVIIICTLAGLLPAWRAARLDPVSALRYE